METVLPLNRSNARHLPEPCVDCVFWQHATKVSDVRAKQRWSDDTQAADGSWGRMLLEDERFRGLVQYGPSGRFVRAKALPAGPASADAGLITCTFLAPDDAPGSAERLVLEALADLKARGLPAAEAFALSYPDEVTISERFVGHHTLFDRAFLEGLGFASSRNQGQVSLMRLDLSGIEPAAGRSSSLVRRLLPQALRPRPATA
ncbi:MAG: hypothetical protein ACR2N6_02465 [Miltoncostaeaceae bacterium]